MKKNDTLTRIPLANATFVSGEGSLCYEDVIDDLGQFTRNYTQTTKRGLLTTNKG